ncbi:hypothetical protein BJ741DRAFT_610218 [Chytriomyces cf. hyalinus JEL632]|nr:hypothetical protein BJ741DRAFT_610218 [Chytriomyces cf. hyalinus JEL632]
MSIPHSLLLTHTLIRCLCGKKTDGVSLYCSARCRSTDGGCTSNEGSFLPTESSSVDMDLGRLKRTTSLVKNLSHLMMEMDLSSTLSSRSTRHYSGQHMFSLSATSPTMSCPSLVDSFSLPRSIAGSEKRQHDESSQALIGQSRDASLPPLALKRRKMVKL